MPPHASRNEPAFRSGVLVEWSETTASIRPSRSPAHRRSRFATSRIGGAHLNAVGAVRDLVGLEGEVVRAGLDRHAFGAVEELERAGGRQVQDVRAAAVSRLASTTPRSLGARPRAAARRGTSRTRARRRRAPRSARPGARRARSAGRRTPRSPSSPRAAGPGPSGGNSSTPDGHRNALNPNTLASCRLLRASRAHPGPRRPRSRRRRGPFACGRPRASPRAPATVVVGGMLFRGMSTIVVTPPPRRRGSRSRTPPTRSGRGSFTWTWVSTRPGRITRSSILDERHAVRTSSNARHALDRAVRDVQARLRARPPA
jgi:hypothetical protein